MTRGRVLGVGIVLVAAAAALIVARAVAPEDTPITSVEEPSPPTVGTATGTTPEATSSDEEPEAIEALDPIELSGAVAGVHDPMAATADDEFWLFSTGPGISVRHSDDLGHWEAAAPVFAADATPQWWSTTVPGYVGRDVWAPDVSWFGGQWHLYYSISLFGEQTAAIGHATNSTLDPASPSFEWVDHGPAVTSGDSDEWTAIDANVVIDANDDPWLAWGSGFGGIWIQRLDAASGELSGSDAVRIAKLGSQQMIEAPFLVHRGGWWYLFTSRNRCCAGVDSTYQINVGRSRQLTGPYVDADDRPLIGVGGTLVLRSEGDVIGPGHNSVLEVDDDWWLVHHFYDGASDGAATLGIRPLAWDSDGWPVVPGPAAGTPDLPTRPAAVGECRPDGPVAEFGSGAISAPVLRDIVDRPLLITVPSPAGAGGAGPIEGPIEWRGDLGFGFDAAARQLLVDQVRPGIEATLGSSAAASAWVQFDMTGAITVVTPPASATAGGDPVVEGPSDLEITSTADGLEVGFPDVTADTRDPAPSSDPVTWSITVGDGVTGVTVGEMLGDLNFDFELTVGLELDGAEIVGGISGPWRCRLGNGP